VSGSTKTTMNSQDQPRPQWSGGN